MLSIIEKLKAENDQLYLKLSDYELLTNKNLTFKIRLGEIEKLRDENAKLKQKLIKFDELNVRSASLNSTNSIIDDLKRQLEDYPRLINEINILTDKIRKLEAIIEKDNQDIFKSE
jgi:DNA repair exonuclease SbcCD ATPase subunit